MGSTTVVSIRLSEDEHKRLVIDSAASGQSKSDYVKACVLDRDAEKIQQRAEDSTKQLETQTKAVESLTVAVQRLHALIKSDNTHETLRFALYGVLGLGVVNLLALIFIAASAIL